MILTEQQVKTIIKKVHVDLILPHVDKYPIDVKFLKGNLTNDLESSIWIGGYDYSKFEEIGADYLEEGISFTITIDDEKGEAIQYSHYTGHWKIKLNSKGYYERIKQLGR